MSIALQSRQLAFPIALLSMAGCSDVGPGAGTPVVPGQSQIRLSDGPFPFDRLARVDLYIVSVSGSISADTGAGGAAFTTLATLNRRFNLLAYQGGTTALLGALSLPTGVISAVRMVIDTDSSSITLKDGRVLTSTSLPGIRWQSSAGRPVLNAVLNDTIFIPGAGAQVVIDYDVGEAFIPVQEISPTSTDSSFIFSPVLWARDARRTGSISGVVRAGSPTGPLVVDASIRLYLPLSGLAAENTWNTIAYARTDANGVFKLPFVTRSAFWKGGAGSPYNVAVDPPTALARARVIMSGVSVVPLQDQSMGTIVLP